MSDNFKITPYRWIILGVFIFINLVVEIQWLTHAAVVRPAELFYQGQFSHNSFLNIDFLAMVYMLVYLIVSFPASYLIDTYGIKKSLTLGAVMVGVFSISKAIFAKSFMGVVISQTGLAIAQPLILNAATAVSARWFPLSERGLAAGLSSLAQYLGIILAMLVTPVLVGSDPDLANYGTGFEKMLWIYGIISALAALALIIFIKESPGGFNINADEQRHQFKEGLLHILKNRDMQFLLVLFLIGLGIFNAISSMTDSIAAKAGVKDSDGLVGGLMIIGGIIGSLILPALSDKFQKRKIFLVICLAGMVPGVFGMAFSGLLSSVPETTYTMLLISSFIIGFFMMSAGPISFQYAAEVSYPAPESASQGLLLWIGQLSGMLFVTGMSIKNNAFLGPFLNLFAVLSLVSLAAVLFLKESKMMTSENK